MGQSNNVSFYLLLVDTYPHPNTNVSEFINSLFKVKFKNLNLPGQKQTWWTPTCLPIASPNMYQAEKLYDKIFTQCCLWNPRSAEDPRTPLTGKGSNSEIKSSADIAQVKNKNHKFRSLHFRQCKKKY